jgi:hypothetical protein
MRFPIKFKSEAVPAVLRCLLPNKPDPLPLLEGVSEDAAFSRCVSAICVDGVWKTTNPARHTGSNDLLRNHLAGRTGLRVLDVGMSDGVTAAELFMALEPCVARFFATDLSLSMRVSERQGVWYFCREQDGACTMAVTRSLIYYGGGTPTANPLGILAARMCRGVRRTETERCISLVNPRLRELAAADPRIMLVAWNVFTPWPHESMDVIRAANILNPAYFPVERLRTAVECLFRALVDGGSLMVVDNRAVEKASILRKERHRLIVAARLGAGCDIESLCLNAVFS